MLNIYVAAPIVGVPDEEKRKIRFVKEAIRRTNGLALLDPSSYKVPNAWGMSNEEWARCVFANDVRLLNEANWVVVCDFGRHSTAGTAWEAGYAFGIDKPVLQVIMSEDCNDYSLMIRGCSANYCTLSELVDGDDFPMVCFNQFTMRGKRLEKCKLN